MPLPIAPTYAGRTIENAGHTPLFFLVTLGHAVRILRHDRDSRECACTRSPGLIGAGAGFLSEVIQKPLRRDASWEDVFADAVGVVCALARVCAVRAPREAARAGSASRALVVALSLHRNIPRADC